MLASNQRLLMCVVARWVGAALTALIFIYGFSGAPTRAGPLVIFNEFGLARAEYKWHGNIQKFDETRLTLTPFLVPAYAEASNPALIKVSAYQDSHGVNAVLADSGVALSELGLFDADAATAYSFGVRSVLFESGTTNFTFVINGGELRIKNFAGPAQISGSVWVTADLEIAQVTGTRQWKFHAALKKVGGAPQLDREPLLNDDGFGIGFPTLNAVMDGNDAVVTIPRFEGTIPLDRAELMIGIGFDYEMAARMSIDSSLINNVGGVARIGDPFSLSTGGPGSDGVQFFLDGMPLGDIERINIPEPTAAMSLIGGVTLCCCLRGTRVLANRFQLGSCRGHFARRQLEWN